MARRKIARQLDLLFAIVGDANLGCDSAGNLTADKDGYEYQYDYENTIVKITKDGNDIQEPHRPALYIRSVAYLAKSRTANAEVGFGPS
jgi:hypothetical protein